MAGFSKTSFASLLRRDEVRCREPVILRALARWARARLDSEAEGSRSETDWVLVYHFVSLLMQLFNLFFYLIVCFCLID